MPTYTFRNKTTGEEWTDIVSIAERDRLLEDSNIEQAIVSGLPIADPHRLGRIKPDKDFNYILKDISKRHPGNRMRIRE